MRVEFSGKKGTGGFTIHAEVGRAAGRRREKVGRMGQQVPDSGVRITGKKGRGELRFTPRIL